MLYSGRPVDKFVVFCKETLKKAKRKFYDIQIILTTLSKINRIQNIIEISRTLNIIMLTSDSRVLGSNLSRTDWLVSKSRRGKQQNSLLNFDG
jgi:hypothetical protein